MSDVTKIRSAELSRRSILRNLEFIAGGAAILGTTMSENRVAAAQTKMTQKAVGYHASLERYYDEIADLENDI